MGRNIDISSFGTSSKARRIPQWTWLLIGMAMFVLIGMAISIGGTFIGGLFLCLPLVVLLFVFCYINPEFCLYTLLALSVFLAFIERYIIQGLFPVGYLIDGFIIISYLMLLGRKKYGERFVDSPYIVLFLWLVYCGFSIILPESPGFEPWLKAFRMHYYLIFGIPLFCMILDVKSLKRFILLWGVLSMVLTLKGIIQDIKLDSVEVELMKQMASTHLLWGKLRVFSFLSDAGQYGVQQAHAAACGLILFLGAKTKRGKIFYLLMAVTGLYGLFASGTRGAVFVLFGATAAYCLLIKNTKLLILGAIAALGFFAVMKYTFIGNQYYSIYRMRTAFRPSQDPSYLVRLNNQQILKAYLSSRPFGGGLGSMQYGHPGTILKETPYDSGYVLTWGDQGIVGLVAFILMYLYFLWRGLVAVWFKIKDKWLKNVVIALIAGVSGCMVSNYGNPIMLQHPTIFILVFSIAVIFIAPRLDEELARMKQANVS